MNCLNSKLLVSYLTPPQSDLVSGTIKIGNKSVKMDLFYN